MASPAAALAKTWGLVTPQRITEGITHRQMAQLLKRAAAKAESMIEANVGRLGTVSGRVTNAQLRAAVAGIQPLSTELWTGTGKVIRSGMYQAAGAAADQSLDLDLILGMPGKALLQYAELMHFNAAQVIEDIISRRTQGYTLAERIYANGKLTTAKVGQIVEQNLVLQRSAREIARETRKFFDPAVPGGTSYAAMRLGRTEINNAHHATTNRLAKKPWVQGMQWNLSASHPRLDPCDSYASVDEYGLGAGVYPPGDAPDKPHPQCLCYLTHVTEEPKDFINNLATGKYDGYLAQDLGVVC